MAIETVYVLRRATFGLLFFPETKLLELLFKKRINSKVVLRKAVGFFEVEKVDQNCLKRVILLRVLVMFYKGRSRFGSTFSTSKNPTAFLRTTFDLILFLNKSSNILVSGENTKSNVARLKTYIFSLGIISLSFSTEDPVRTYIASERLPNNSFQL